jgi:hypothetical protein
MHMGRPVSGHLFDPVDVFPPEQRDSKARPDGIGKFVRDQSSEYENGNIDAAFAKFHGFLKLGNSKQIGPFVDQTAGNGYGPVAVGIGLDHRYQACRSDLFSNCTIVESQVIKMDTGAGSRIHGRFPKKSWQC